MTARTCIAAALSLIVLASSGCGAKGPPLAPLRPVPAAPSELAATRVGDRVTLRLLVPQANADPSSPLSISAIEIYARTLPMGSEAPTAEQLIRKEFLVATIPVRPPPPVTEPGEAATPAPPPVTAAAKADDTRPGPGEMVIWSEAIPVTALRPLELTRAQEALRAIRRTAWVPIRPTGLLAPWFRMPLPTRYYAAVGVSERRRAGMPSAFAAVQFGPAPEAPTDFKVDSNETQLVVSWTTATPNAPVSVIETTSTGVEKPAPVQDQPITTGSWSAPVVFGVERCFEVRPVDKVAEATVIGPASPRTCITPVDTFAPAAPRSLAVIAGSGSINLIWDANSERDIAGYLVLRAEAPSDTLLPVTKEPVAAATFRDDTVRPGVRYIYSVVAVDRAGNQSAESNRQEETAK